MYLPHLSVIFLFFWDRRYFFFQPEKYFGNLILFLILWFWDGWVFLKGRKPVAQLETRVEACFDHTGKARCFATNLKNIGIRILKIYDWILETVINKPFFFYISIYKLISSSMILITLLWILSHNIKLVEQKAQLVPNPDCKCKPSMSITLTASMSTTLTANPAGPPPWLQIQHVHHPDCKHSISTTLTASPACPTPLLQAQQVLHPDPDLRKLLHPKANRHISFSLLHQKPNYFSPLCSLFRCVGLLKLELVRIANNLV